MGIERYKPEQPEGDKGSEIEEILAHQRVMEVRDAIERLTYPSKNNKIHTYDMVDGSKISASQGINEHGEQEWEVVVVDPPEELIEHAAEDDSVSAVRSVRRFDSRIIVSDGVRFFENSPYKDLEVGKWQAEQSLADGSLQIPWGEEVFEANRSEEPYNEELHAELMERLDAITVLNDSTTFRRFTEEVLSYTKGIAQEHQGAYVAEFAVDETEVFAKTTLFGDECWLVEIRWPVERSKKSSRLRTISYAADGGPDPVLVTEYTSYLKDGVEHSPEFVRDKGYYQPEDDHLLWSMLQRLRNADTY